MLGLISKSDVRSDAIVVIKRRTFQQSVLSRFMLDLTLHQVHVTMFVAEML